MPAYSTQSQKNLDTCDPKLQLLFKTVLPVFDHTIIEGARSLERQKELFQAGKSETMNSRHLVDYETDPYAKSKAVDVKPYPGSWAFEAEILKAAREGDEVALMKFVHNVQRWALFVGHVLMAASMLGIKIRWGGDWDRDLDLMDQKFDDWPHFELVD